jgi:hypothetical protein
MGSEKAEVSLIDAWANALEGNIDLDEIDRQAAELFSGSNENLSDIERIRARLIVAKLGFSRDFVPYLDPVRQVSWMIHYFDVGIKQHSDPKGLQKVLLEGVFDCP